MVVEHALMVHTCFFFLCTCHIGMTGDTQALYDFGTTLGTSYMLIPQVFLLQVGPT